MSKGEDKGDKEVEQLLDLARDKSVDGRTRLVQIVGDLFFDDASVLSERERILMTDILRQLIHDVEMTVRKALAERLSEEPGAPPELVRTLANDQVEVAHPILLKSTVLQDIELIEIVQHRTLEHQLAIAMRDTLSVAVSDALVDTGNAKVIQTLIENPTAKISETTLEHLVEESKLREPYQEPLLDRPDMSPHLAKRMYWWVSAALRQHIVEHFKVDTADLDEKIESTIQDILSEDPSDPDVKKGNGKKKSKPVLMSPNEERKITPQLLLQVLRKGEIAMFESLFSQLTGLRSNLVRRLIFEPGGEGLAIACKHIAMTKSDFGSMFLLSRSARPGDKKVDPNEVATAMKFYDTIKPETAEKVVARWKLDPDYLYALKQVEKAKKAKSAAAAE